MTEREFYWEKYLAWCENNDETVDSGYFPEWMAKRQADGARAKYEMEHNL